MKSFNIASLDFKTNYGSGGVLLFPPVPTFPSRSSLEGNVQRSGFLSLEAPRLERNAVKVGVRYFSFRKRESDGLSKYSKNLKFRQLVFRKESGFRTRTRLVFSILFFSLSPISIFTWDGSNSRFFRLNASSLPLNKYNRFNFEYGGYFSRHF
ncbi:Uncharacterized protein XB16_1978 [Leptospira santarosai]|uniref:Uncharacterized protein n=1 Tax=Leptospira santarosai TaxID=28183 RepID=A0A2P1QTS1_9LEPT|nr:Uncharacterized protein XB16_1978 [Leptospira santarosai]